MENEVSKSRACYLDKGVILSGSPSGEPFPGMISRDCTLRL